ncbi:NAD-dependent epimerase [Flavobacteriaceae bacterium MHTCC 0001]
MKVLITGAAGFIGFHLMRRLAERGISTFGIDNFDDYYDINLKYARLREIGITHELSDGKILQSTIYDRCTFLALDIVNLHELKTLFANHKFTHVVNLAAQAGIRYSLKNPHAYIQSNVVGFMNVLECCRNNAIKHLVYASSSSVYGNTDNVPFSENNDTNTPLSIYAVTKRSNELMAYTYSHLYNLPTTGLRFFTVYGPWGRPDMAPMLFANAISNGGTIKVFNDGDMERDFTYIDDIIQGIERVIYNDPMNADNNAKHEIYNIGNSCPIKLMDFIQGLEAEMGSTALKKFMPMQSGEAKVTYADTSKLVKAIGYSPNTKLNDGLKHFVDWYKDYYTSNKRDNASLKTVV